MSYLSSGLRLKIFNRKSELQTGGVGFERSGYLGGREGLMKGTIELGIEGSSVFGA